MIGVTWAEPYNVPVICLRQLWLGGEEEFEIKQI